MKLSRECGLTDIKYHGSTMRGTTWSCTNCGNYFDGPNAHNPDKYRVFSRLHQTSTIPKENQMAKTANAGGSAASAFPISSNVMFSKYRAVGIKFTNYGELSGKQYTIFTDINVKDGDYVVADTTNGPVVAVVTQTVGLTKFDREKANRLIISKINMKKVAKKYDAMVQLQELRTRLQERKDEIEEMAVLRLLAQTDPEAKKMMADLYKMTGDATYQIPEEPNK